MKKAFALAVLVIAFAGPAAAAEEGRFFTYPTIHNDKIVFTYEADLWTVSAQGGVASRLTTFPGTESFAKLSPDGKWLAFTASYDGATAVYLMPAEGGAPVRLTYTPGGVQAMA
jgi:tricorn protease